MNSISPSSATRSSPLWRRLAGNVALFLCAVLLALLLAEFFLRLFGLGRAPAIVSQENPNLFIRSSVEELHYELRPNFAGRAFGCDVRINSHGMRSPERAVAKSPGVRRVLVLGDSVAFGHGVEQSAIFPALLEKRLSVPAGGRAVEFINAAVPGYNSEQERIALGEKGMAWQPDLVIVVQVLNDVEPAYDLNDKGSLQWKEPPAIYREVMERYIVGRGVGGFLRRHVRVVALLDRVIRQPYLISRKYLDYVEGLYGEESAGWRECRRALEAMNVMCRSRGVPMVLAYWPVPAQPEPNVFREIRENIGAFALQEGITYWDLDEAIKNQRVNQITISTLDRHPNALGHQLIAEHMEPLIAAQLSR